MSQRVMRKVGSEHIHPLSDKRWLKPGCDDYAFSKEIGVYCIKKCYLSTSRPKPTSITLNG
jgi:hypothetical protein